MPGERGAVAAPMLRAAAMCVWMGWAMGVWRTVGALPYGFVLSSFVGVSCVCEMWGGGFGGRAQGPRTGGGGILVCRENKNSDTRRGSRWHPNAAARCQTPADLRLDWRRRSRPSRSRRPSRRQGPPPPSSGGDGRSHDERRLLPRRTRVDRRLVIREWLATLTRIADGRHRRLGVARLSAAARWPSLADFGVCGGKSR
eukprot:scaffold3795_cov126-Isochrysis_galbana.AAC.19